MPHDESILNLFANYAAQVGRHLPLKGKADIRRELECTLADRLDDRLEHAGRSATLEDAYALLLETGHPVKTAAAYYGHKHLIGPALYPFFMMVTRVALPVLAAILFAVLVLTAAFEPGRTPFQPWELLGILATTAQAVLCAFGVLVLLFMAIEKLDPVLRSSGDVDPFKDWHPRELGLKRPRRELKISDQIGAIVGSVIGLVMILHLPALLAFALGLLELPTLGAIFSPRFLDLIPLFAAVSLFELLLSVFLLTRRAHTTATLLATVAGKLAGMVAGGILLGVWTFLIPGAEATPAMASGIEIANQALRILCGIGIIGGGVEAAQAVVRHLREGER